MVKSRWCGLVLVWVLGYSNRFFVVLGGWGYLFGYLLGRLGSVGIACRRSRWCALFCWRELVVFGE